MKSFDEYYWHQFDVLNKDIQLARKFGQDVWDYKQVEVDDLIDIVKTSADSEKYLFDELQKVKKERDELQKVIDEILDYANRSKHVSDLGNLEIIDISRGNKND